MAASAHTRGQRALARARTRGRARARPAPVNFVTFAGTRKGPDRVNPVNFAERLLSASLPRKGEGHEA
jgi:hypothetical protein